ncbi:chorismate mutase [uncultured Cohaesibacter sp.]|uniref:chorismate mutase n=1 Tax=uncultured Cohaesibacter sp. TaxID=1002546 RepID=UPI0029300641|nr:chorismate mutase [uncultured Cohaesibacter sp.]
MSKSPEGVDESNAPTLDELRQKIDRIDQSIHNNLIERSEIIEALIAVKRTDKPGAAFRPGREMNMMRRLVSRHRGILPITTVEHIWREIIATFTHMQAPFSVVVAPGSELRDVARFYFGFTVGFAEGESAVDVIEQVHEGNGSVLGVVDNHRQAESAWWIPLSMQGVQVIARLPVINQVDRPAALDAFVLSMPLMDTSVPDMRLVALSAPSSEGVQSSVEAIGGQLVSCVMQEGHCECLAAVPFSVADVAVEKLTRLADNPMIIRGTVGGFWSPVSLSAAE